MTAIYLMILLTSLAIVTASINLYAIMTAALFASFFMMQYLYLPAATVLKRWTGDSASAVFVHVDESLHGMDVIRAFGAVDYFIQVRELAPCAERSCRRGEFSERYQTAGASRMHHPHMHSLLLLTVSETMRWAYCRRTWYASTATTWRSSTLSRHTCGWRSGEGGGATCVGLQALSTQDCTLHASTLQLSLNQRPACISTTSPQVRLLRCSAGGVHQPVERRIQRNPGRFQRGPGHLQFDPATCVLHVGRARRRRHRVHVGCSGARHVLCDPSAEGEWLR